MLFTQKQEALYDSLHKQRREASVEELSLRRKRSTEAKQRRQELQNIINELTNKINNFILEEGLSLIMPEKIVPQNKDLNSVEYYTELYEIESQLEGLIKAIDNAELKLISGRAKNVTNYEHKQDVKILAESIQDKIDALEIDDKHKFFWKLNQKLIKKEITVAESLEALSRHFSSCFITANWCNNHLGFGTRKSGYEIFIEEVSGYPELWWSIWSIILAEYKCVRVEDITREQFNSIFSKLLANSWQSHRISAASSKTVITLLVWMLSDLQDTPKFTSKLTFNAVRQDYMITPRVSLSKLMSCKTLSNVTKEQVIELFGKKKTKPSNEPVWCEETNYLPCTLNKRIFVKSPKPKRAKSRYEIYYSVDEDNIYLTADYRFTYHSPADTAHWKTVALSKTSENFEWLISHIETTLDLTPEAIVVERKTEEYKDFIGKPFSINYISINK
jgi:hypothetical protein